MSSMLRGKGKTLEEKEETPDWSEYKDKLGRTFADTIKARNRLWSQKKELEAQIDSINSDLLKRMKTVPADSVLVDGTRVTYVTTTRRTIKADRLIAKGVDPAVVDACTEESVSEFIKVTPPREEE